MGGVIKERKLDSRFRGNDNGTAQARLPFVRVSAQEGEVISASEALAKARA